MGKVPIKFQGKIKKNVYGQRLVNQPIESSLDSRLEETMDEMKLKRGTKEVVFHKIPYKFGIRFKYETSIAKNSLESHCGSLGVRLEHLGCWGVARIDVFEVEDETKLDDVMDILRACPRSDIVSHVYRLDESMASEVIPTGILTIQFDPNVQNNERAKIFNEFSLEVLEDLDFLLDGYTVKLSKEAMENPLKVAAKLQQKKEVKAADPDIIFKVAFHYHPLEPLYNMQWHLKNQGDLLCTVKGADVNAEGAWDYTKGLRDIVICFIDNGFDLSHPKFNAHEKIVSPIDFADNGPEQSSFSNESHGTACAGLALAEEDGFGTIGLAPKCAFMPIRMPAEISDNTFAAIFKYAMSHNADVICCGWGAEAMHFPLSTVMNAIIHKAATEGRKNKKGCVILFAAGNNNCPLDSSKGGTLILKSSIADHYLKRGTHLLNGFAAHPNVIVVGASNSLDKRATYSNYGPELSICAPSSGGANARCIVTTSRRSSLAYNSDGYTSQFDGTSGATSLAAGLAGLILSLNPELTSFEVKRIMMETADKIDLENGKYDNRGHSPYYGHGRINAYKAVKSISKSSHDLVQEMLGRASGGS